MKSTLVVLALAALCCSGCRAFHWHRDQACAEPCAESCAEPCAEPCSGPECAEPCEDECCEPCHVTRAKHAPRPIGSHGYGRGGNLEHEYPGGKGCCFDSYCGSKCGPGYGPGPYDCSPCGSPHWGCTGHRHPHGYKDGRGCLCHGQAPCPCPQPGPHCPCCCGHGYCCNCCGPPAPGGACCPCGGASGDQNYNFTPGPPVAQTAYPYYTLRGPRDFLLDNPPSIGPY
jgi:hypothetical protein